MNHIFKKYIPILIPLIFMYVFYKYSDISKLESVISKLDIPILLLSTAIYSSTYIFRALRLKLFFPDIPNINMICTISVHTFLNNVMPFRSGEFSLPLMLNKFSNINIPLSTGVLITVRFFDLISILILFFISATLINKGIALLAAIALLLTAILAVSLTRILRHVPIENIKMYTEQIVKSSTDKMLYIAMYSILTWILKFISFFLIIKAVGMDITYMKTVFVSTFGELTTILPIHSIGGYGTYEAGLTGGLSVIGIKLSEALSISLYFHTAILINSAILASTGWLYLTTILDKNTL